MLTRCCHRAASAEHEAVEIEESLEHWLRETEAAGSVAGQWPDAWRPGRHRSPCLGRHDCLGRGGWNCRPPDRPTSAARCRRPWPSSSRARPPLGGTESAGRSKRPSSNSPVRGATIASPWLRKSMASRWAGVASGSAVPPPASSMPMPGVGQRAVTRRCLAGAADRLAGGEVGHHLCRAQAARRWTESPSAAGGGDPGQPALPPLTAGRRPAARTRQCSFPRRSPRTACPAACTSWARLARAR